MKVTLVLLAAAASASAHATWQESWVGTKDMAGTCVRTVQDNSPIASVTDAAMTCGRGPKASTGLCEVAAGSPFTVEMHQQPGDRSCTNQALGGNHYGPVMVYMAKVTDAKAADAKSASWFKVAEDGYTGTTASWGTEIMNANCGKRAFTVPKSIASGNYLVRAEAIALHAGAGQPQPYVSCFQVNVINGGSANPAGVSFPGAYKTSDALFSVSIWDSNFKYVSAGPAVYTG